MTRARSIALAVLFGACWMGHSHAFAQGSPDYSGYAVHPQQAFSPGEAPYLQQGLDANGAPQPGAYPGAPVDSGGYGMYPDGGGYGGYPPPAQDVGWYGGYDEFAGSGQVAGKQPFLSGSTFRVEYLNWTIRSPGKVLLGAPILAVPDPTIPQQFFDNGGALQGTGFVPTLEQVNLKNLSGVRGTLDLDLYYGDTLEFSAFMLERASSSVEYDQLQFSQGQVLTSTFINGELANQNNLFSYNRQFKANYTSSIWGAEGNYLFDMDREGFLQVRPFLGARFMSVHEGLTQEGVFTSTQLIAPDVISTIDSVSYNQLTGGQFGFRGELVTKYFVLGAEPKYALMANAGTAEVTTNHFRSNLDPVVTTNANFLTFSSVFEIGTYAKINFTPRFTMGVGYNYMFITRVSRAANNIYYNEISPLDPPAVVVRKSFNDISVQGITITAEYRF